MHDDAFDCQVGSSALFLAADVKSVECVKALVAAGSRPDIATSV